MASYWDAAGLVQEAAAKKADVDVRYGVIMRIMLRKIQEPGASSNTQRVGLHRDPLAGVVDSFSFTTITSTDPYHRYRNGCLCPKATERT